MEQDKTLAIAKQFYDQGFAIHWLHPKSKRPVDSGWTKGPRHPWLYLRETYRPELNLGVRLGEASKVGGGFLGVIDVDVKSTEPRHVKEVEAKLDELLHGKKLPEVKSGRGNGSRHLYITTPKPITPAKAFQSLEVVRVLMPSAKPSKRDLAALSPEEIEAGYRMRAAWEIAFMGQGQQVVLPPSVHPDSGKRYTWQSQFDAGLAAGFDEEVLKHIAPIVTDAKPTTAKAEPKATLDGFEVVPVELSWLPLAPKIKAMIETGEGVEDRSAMLLPISKALLNAGLSRNEILTVLTDPDNYIGPCSFEHAKTKDRARAARWVYSYTLARVEEENRPGALFSSDIVEEPPQLDFDTQVANEEAFEEFSALSQNTGFYFVGAKGGLIADYQGLLDYFKEDRPFKTIADMRSIYVFEDSHYRHFSPIEVKSFAEENFNPMPTEKIRLEFLNKVLANNVDVRSFFTRTTENKINFNNGVLILDEGFMGPQLVEHSPEFGFRGVLPYDYDPHATCPFFDKWVDGIMLGDKELVAVLQEFMGYIVRGGDYKYHKALWLGGRGRNGKSTFIDLLKALIGSGNFSTISIKSLISDKFAGADLDGKFANFSEETSPQELADSGPFKNLTGDGEIYAQKKYGDPYSFRNRAKLIMTYNQIPDLKDLSTGMLSRPLIIPFKKFIKDDDQDRDIKRKLHAELPGIFNFALAGWDRLERQNGFTVSTASKEALKKVREESCNVFQWVENNVTFEEDDGGVDPYRQLTPKELYAAYSLKERYAFKAIEFCRRLNDHPKMRQRHKRVTSGVVYFGVKI